ncbi:MAG: DUF2235 domain-containing protein [Nocardioides sp.]
MSPASRVRQASDESPDRVTRNLVVCLDGTSNEPETGRTNVARLYAVAAKTEQQLVYYDPGVGTLGAPGAVTPLAKKATTVAGLVAGYGVSDNLEQAYTFLMQNYRHGDQIYAYGFSRGAYTARALTGMLRTVGLLRPGAENLVPYARKLYTQAGKQQQSRNAAGATTSPEQTKQQQKYWKVRRDFAATFGNPAFPGGFDTSQRQVHFLGVWDTVKSIGWLNWKARWQEARWPYTRKLENIGTARHAISIDERRRPFPSYRFAPAPENADQKELWFAGVHSDVGGQYVDDHRLSDFAFTWMVDESRTAGLVVDEAAVRRELRGLHGDTKPDPTSVPKMHQNAKVWMLAGGWRRREVLPGDSVHPSVLDRIRETADGPHPYRPRLPESVLHPATTEQGAG